MKYTWRIKRKYKGAWIDITKQPQKTGLSAPFNFGPQVVGEQFLLEAYKETKNIFTQKNETHKMGEILVIPASSKEPKITKVVLFNRGARDVNKASYTDKLVARAYCVGMFGKTINFHLWEDDAAGGGHNAEVNKNNRINRAYPAKVNVDGIAEAVIPLSADQNVMKQIANRFMMRGDANEGAFHEFYVTASYDGKILGANQTNVDVANPDHNRTQTPQRTNTNPPPPRTNPPAQPQQNNQIAESIKFMIDTVMNVFKQEQTKTATSIEQNQSKQEDNKTCKRCSDPISIDLLKQIYPNCKDSKILEELATYLNKYRKDYKLDSCAKKAHFFAQSIQEAGTDLKGALHGESLDYSAEGLPIQFKAFRKRNANGQAVDKNGNPTEDNKKTVPNDLAYLYGRSAKNNYVANQRKIAEIAYGNRPELGNKTVDDTWNFRGRGLLQITGRTTYGNIQKRINKFASSENIKIDDGFDRDYSPKEAALTGMADWYKDDMFVQAEKTGTMNDNDVVNLITNIINSNTDSKEARRKNYQKTKVIFQVASCKNIGKEKPVENNTQKPGMLSKYLSYNQAIASDTAKKNNLDNTPGESDLSNLKALGLNIYDKIYENFNGKVKLNSVYRSEKVNKKVGGSITSQHRYGQALDIVGTGGVTNKQIFKYVMENLDYHQIIWEYGSSTEPSWVHVGYKPSGNKKKNTRAISTKNGTSYINFNLKI